jgi:hypothetical protein
LNFIFGIVCLFVCVCAFSLRRESPDMILGDKPLIFEVVLSQVSSVKNIEIGWTYCYIVYPIYLYKDDLLKIIKGNSLHMQSVHIGKSSFLCRAL